MLVSLRGTYRNFLYGQLVSALSVFTCPHYVAVAVDPVTPRAPFSSFMAYEIRVSGKQGLYIRVYTVYIQYRCIYTPYSW